MKGEEGRAQTAMAKELEIRQKGLGLRVELGGGGGFHGGSVTGNLPKQGCGVGGEGECGRGGRRWYRCVAGVA